MKIVYCLDSINSVGGTQKVTITKANALASLPGNEVWIIVADNSGDRVFDISATVHFVDLRVNYYEDDWKSRWNVIKGIIVKRHIHKTRLTVWLHRICPDVVVAIGQSEKFFLPSIKGDWATVREFHFTRDYRQRNAGNWFETAFAWVGSFFDRIAFRKYDKIVVLTQEDRERNWRKWDRVSIIPNPLTISSAEQSLLEERSVIAIGRLSYQKNYDSMIRAFSRVTNLFPGWRLDIVGDGSEKMKLKQLIADLSLTKIVFLHGNTQNVVEEMIHSSMLVFTSRFEGFGMVLVEAMSCGLPVVSYDCPCGPKDIVTDGVDGFLVPFGDEDKLADRICELIADNDLRKKMGAAAQEKSRQYSLDRIIPMWMDLFTDLVRQKKQG